jgi:hypothetical protein
VQEISCTSPGFDGSARAAGFGQTILELEGRFVPRFANAGMRVRRARSDDRIAREFGRLYGNMQRDLWGRFH